MMTWSPRSSGLNLPGLCLPEADSHPSNFSKDPVGQEEEETILAINPRVHLQDLCYHTGSVSLWVSPSTRRSFPAEH